MNTDNTGVTDLLIRASDDLNPDVDRLISGGLARGRSRQRRAQIGTTVASLAVIGVVGGLAAVVPQIGTDRTAGSIATDGASATSTPEPTPTPPPTLVTLAVPETEFPGTVGEILGLTNVSVVLPEPSGQDHSSEDIKGARFRVDGMLVMVVVHGGEVGGEVGDFLWSGDRSTPNTKSWSSTDGVMARDASAWRDGYVITATAYNAAEDSDSPALAAEPVLSKAQLLEVVTSDVWFEGTPLPQATPAVAGSVAGAFGVSGGPYPGVDGPLSGTITFDGRVAEEVTASDGTFALELPPGIYTVTGQPLEGRFAPTTCPSQTVTVVAEQVTTVEVSCVFE